MTATLSTLAVGFAAFCVWLIVRVVNRRERWAKWTLAGLLFGLPAAYFALYFSMIDWPCYFDFSGPGPFEIPPNYRIAATRLIARGGHRPVGWSPWTWAHKKSKPC